MKKILIAVPCMQTVPAEFAHSLALLNKVEECAVIFKVGSLIYTSREEIAKTAIECGADYIFWLDSDMVFAPDTLTRMFKTIEENDEIDILSGLYFRRVPPYTPVLFDVLKCDDEGCTWSEFKTVPAEIFKIGGCGFGCVLTPTDIFIDVMNKYNTMFTPVHGVGEDLSFCWRARSLGFNIYCDPSILLGHVGQTVITKDFFLSYQESKTGDKSNE